MKDLKNFEQNEAELQEDVTIILNQNTEETAAEKQPSVEKSGLAKALEQVIAKSQKQEQRAKTEAQVVKEIRSLRAADRKVYELNGGVRRTEYYPAPVHCFNETSGCYEEIGNYVSENTDTFYQAERDHFTAKFSRDEADDTLFSMERGMYRVTVKAGQLAARLESPRKAAFARAKTAAADAAVLLPAEEDRLRFKNYAQNTDLECKIGRKGVEERIVIHKKRPSYRYSFRLHCENVVPEQSEADGRIMLRSAETGEEVFYLPVPSLTDANGAFSDGVMLEMTEADSNKEIQVTVLADSEWMDAEERAFPVEVHPQLNAAAPSQIRISGYTENNGMTYKVGRAADPCCCPGGSGNTGGGNSESGSTGTGGCSCGGNTCGGLDIEIDPKDESGRVILSFVPEIKTTQKVQLVLYVKEKCGDCKNCRLATIQPFRVLPENGKCRYYFDITEYAAQCTSYELEVIPVLPGGSGGTCCEDSCCCGGTEINGEESAYPPTLIVEKDMSFAVNLLSNAVTQELGQYGTGGVDIYRGNRLFAATDFTWEGGRMPVTIEHLYNGIFGEYEYTENAQLLLHTANFSNMKIGKGWKLNVMQSMRETNGKYVYTAANGAELEFIPYSEWKANQDKTDQIDPDLPVPAEPEPRPDVIPTPNPEPTPGISNGDLCPNIYVFGPQGEIQYDAVGQVLRVGDAGSYYFDNGGRLIKTEDRYGNRMLIKYTGGRITSVTDGAGRAFSFSYTSAGYLSSITAPDDTAVKYGYENGYLKSITYPDGRKTEFATANGKSIVILKAANGSEVYVVEYEYYNKFAKLIREYGVKSGKQTLTKTTEIKNQSLKNTRQVEISEPTDQTAGDKDYIRMEYRFDNKGNIVSSHFWTAEDTRMLPQNGSYCENLLVNPGFERNINAENGGWISVQCGTNIVENKDRYMYFGKRSLHIRNICTEEESGVEQTAILSPNSYTFSAHIQISNDFAGSGQSGVLLRITDTQGNVIAESERISRKTPGYARLSVPFSLTTQRTVKCKIIAIGTGTAYIDGAQLEEGTGANSYNLVENGTFTKGLDCWEYASKVNGITTNIRTAGSLNVNGHSSLTYNGFQTNCLSDYPHQVIPVNEAEGTRETFTLSGWAYRFSDEEGGEKSPLVLLGEINYVNESVASETMPLVYSSEVNGWQHLTGAFRKKKFEAVKNVTVYCCNTEPTDTCCFADIRLIRSGRELLLKASDFNSETENEEQEDFKEYVDSYGNTITETVYGEESGVTLYRSYGYSANGNDMKEITDERGGKILITTDAATSRITGIKDRTGVQTNYEYDTAGRVKKMVCKSADQKTLGQVSYEYDHFDHLTGITRGDGMKYVFGFNECGKTESVTLKGHSKPLAKYTYKNGGGKLKQVVYANGEKANVTYNSLGQLIVKESRDGSGAVMERIKYDYDAQGNVVRAVDYFNRKEYTYTYSEGNIIRTVENDITVDGDERITKRTRCIAVNYEYENDGRLRRKYIDTVSGKQEYSSTQSGERNVHLNLTCGGNTYRSEIYTDDLGRITSDNIVLGSGNLQRRFTYAAGSKTAEHVAHGKCRTDATTNLVKEISFTNGRTLKYEYDREERITRVTDSKAGTTQYTYDGQGRLLTETVNGAVKNTLSYDDYGNILSKNGMAYTYDTVWKDQLKTLGGEAITYDALGNPTRYKGYTLSWKNGRMKSFGEHTYAYNASGIRTEKVAKGVKHSYLLDGTRIVSERWSGQELIPMYDAEGSVYGMLYDGTAYYYLRNLQGDVLAIVDGTGKTLVEYAYDAWGKCSVVSDVSGKTLSSVNPYRYRGYYYDQETGLYYLNARYYDPEVGRFLSADDTSYLDTEVLGGQNLYAYCLNNPVMMVDYAGCAPWWSWVLSGLQLIAGVALCFVPGAQGIGISMIISGSLGLIANIFEGSIAQAIGGVGSIAGGGGAVSTGISLLAFGPIGWAVGGVLMLVGAATIAFGANDIATAITGTNYIQQWTGMSDSAYGWTRFGLNIASSIGCFAGRMYMNSRTTFGTSRTGKTGNAYSRYYQMEGDKVVSVTHYGKGGIRQYRIDVLGDSHYIKSIHQSALPHKHLWVINDGHVNKAPEEKVSYLLWRIIWG